MRLTRGEWAVLIFTGLYIASFLAYFVMSANREFIGYLFTMLVLVVLTAWGHRRVRFPIAMLWALTGWGIAHMAGGGIHIGESVLYNLVLIPFGGSGELRLLKYDQMVHFYGFAVMAWMLWYILQNQFSELRRTRTIYVFATLGSMGLGALNEIIEFSAVMLVANTNVGGYYNTALDLVFNGLGAVAATTVCAFWDRCADR